MFKELYRRLYPNCKTYKQPTTQKPTNRMEAIVSASEFAINSKAQDKPTHVFAIQEDDSGEWTVIYDNSKELFNGMPEVQERDEDAPVSSE